ncbi:tRNA dihydrouridine synthase DusB [Hoeflea sp. TYP-13]|uniref:tRNA dihydrouridine synthase DusB n=1 Tax=Hoeflea sp. TYP-13 TaxID=3230023 RepID=UPI0034C6D236
MIEQSFDIGPVRIRNRAVLAPMSGISDLPFRRLAWRYGAGLVVTEMVASRELVCDRNESWVRLQGEGITPHMVQLAGREARWMREAAIIAEANGADIIDINMGCPAKKVTGGYSGSALMRDPDHALELIEATVAAVKVPVTVKMRLGWDENSMNAPELAHRAELAGAQMITVHGRTRSQFYKGRADWNAIRAVREVINIPLTANGDVENSEDVERIMELSGADAVMIGRAAQGRPWLVGQLAGARNAPISRSEILEIVLEHYEMNIAHHGADVGVRHFRKHLSWYLDRHVPGCPQDLKVRLMTACKADAVVSNLVMAFAETADGSVVKKAAA